MGDACPQPWSLRKTEASEPTGGHLTERNPAIARGMPAWATYINAEQLAGHVDPGAEAVARLFEQLSARLRKD
ncbi:MAG: hypothetical protein BM562_07120 [Alphaproteobacteria bacterium MedPE-SWcel]|nr:MAG: hypothetical protein BM562_07120 [Alphaproteobacteria bacterium MedPE-SWcel]